MTDSENIKYCKNLQENSKCIEQCKYLQVAHELFDKVAVKRDHLDGIKIWIGASKNDITSIQTKKIYTCVLRKLGANIITNGFEAILSNRVPYDVILMFTFTPGASARAIELIITSKLSQKAAKDKMHIYMPQEYSKGYISRKFSSCIIATNLCHRRKIDFKSLNKSIFCKCVANLIDVINDRNEEMKLTFKPRIAILTALPKEFEMMKSLLSDQRLDRSFKDEAIQFPHGQIASNHVVLAMSGMGNNLSSAIATKLYDKYPSIKYTFIVGIAGGIPDFKNHDNHVRLGDIVLSDDKGVLQYDMSKTTIGGKEYNFSPRPPDATIFRNAKVYVESIGNKKYKFWQYLDNLLKEKNISRPKEEILDESPWKGNRLYPTKTNGNNNRPKLHFGSIASANTVVKDIKLRDQLKNDFKAKAIEMESSGVADAAWLNGKSYFVVRGICDYANPIKNKVWQEYAAAAAAAFTYEIIEETLNG